MIEDSTTYYLGTVDSGASYKLAKYKDEEMTEYSITTNAKVGLLRMGELMAGQFNRYENNATYWILTPYNSASVRSVNNYSIANYYYSPSNDFNAVHPSLNLKSNVIITSGDGTLQNPFQIELAS